jgi:trk system potassium uptake protein TrkA
VASVPAAGDSVVAEVPVPASFLGRSIGDLDIRREYGVSILMVKHTGEGKEELTTAPTAGYVFHSGDVLLVLGATGRIPSLRAGRPRRHTPAPQG